ncbi:MAG: thymidine phosphorylase, partial [Balneolaceae bacterium]|nr:thymidine phosphorylase [Balneolaceae bacterium]
MKNSRYNAVTLIRKKRDREALTADEIEFLVRSYTENSLPDYQMSAFLMASFLNGLNAEEAAALTKSMLHSGTVLNLKEIEGTKVDKHSTGGVGDKLSLILAPIVASCGVPVPMISGRGLGHTGGTLDKLESIPGFTVDMSLDRYREILKKHNLVLSGQTSDIAPADKGLYALRDVTATVESIPLIAGSIMSKKLAEGIDALVLDVKFGSGAFMKNKEDAIELAKTLVKIGEDFDKNTIAYLTSMEQPLGMAVGNWPEVKESIEALNGNGPDDVMAITHLLAGTMIHLGGKAESVDEGIEISKASIRDGTALQKWKDIVK